MLTQTRSWLSLPRVLALILCSFLLAACSHLSGDSSGTTLLADACSGNRFLMRFGCSVDRVQSAAQGGNADAQYALGYMYYYGIGTVQDRSTGRMWIQRAASQGQPLAQRAMRLLARGQHPTSGSGGGGGGSTSIHQPKADVAQMNTQKPTSSMKSHLPAYGKSKKKPVLDVLKREPDTKSSEEAIKPSTTQPTSQLNNPTRTQRMASQTESHDRHFSRVKKTSHMAQQQTTTPQPTRVSDKPMAAATEKAMPAGQNMTAVEQAMLQVPSNSYTLQLMGSHDLKAVKSFIRRHRLAGQVQYYEANFNDRPWYMLVYGDYASIMQARTAIANLPPALRAMHPWVKSFKIVQKEIEYRKIVS